MDTQVIQAGLMRIYPLIGLMLLTLGCAAKKPAQINLLIPPSALLKPIELQQCDPNTDPPKCKKAIVSYKKSQAVVVMK